MSQFHSGTRSRLLSSPLLLLLPLPMNHHHHHHHRVLRDCQHIVISFVSPLLSLFAVPRTEILGEPDRYVKAGSNVVLRCIVRGALEPPTFIMWYHGAEQLAADSRRHRTQLDPNLPEANGEGQSTVSCPIVPSQSL